MSNSRLLAAVGMVGVLGVLVPKLQVKVVVLGRPPKNDAVDSAKRKKTD